MDDYAKAFLHPYNLTYHSTYNCSRWYDKLQIIVCPDGQSAVNLEHTLCDGHILINYMKHICSKTNFKVTNSYDNINNYKSEDFKESFKMLQWEINSQMIHNIKFARKIINHELKHIDIKVLDYKKFGSSFAKEHKMSPDGLFQMAYQLTYYKMFGEFANTYESVQMRQYKGGRTNNWRVVTEKSMALCKVFFEKSSTDSEIKDALLDTIRHHCKGIVNCQKLEGCFDRHLFALNMLNSDSKKVELFNNPIYKKMMEFNLSTSNSSGYGGKSVKMFGFNPVNKSGFGVGYVINNNDACICVTSNMMKSNEFISILQVCLSRIYDLFI
jgi:hypothetical protein